ncbi:kinase-like domain-containing protein [Penicillium sp. DV-2018c]|nr:kinase-like domain-containing protein [Penicillium sp. DV-2018c]
MPAATTRDYSNAPGILTPPEVHFEKPMSLSFSADIWTLACTIWSIIAQRTLFDAWFPTPDRIIEEQVRCLGKLPEPWWGKWDARGKSFNEDGRCKKEEDMRTLEHRFADSVREPRQKEFAMQEMQHMGEVEKGALLSMIRAMLAFRPEERATVDEVLRCEWMQRWALPEFDRAR